MVCSMALKAKHITALSEAMATGCTVKIGDTDLVFSPLTFGDLGAILQFNKSKMVQTYLAAVAIVGEDRVTRFHTMQDMQLRAARKADFIPDDPARLIFMAWLSLKHAHPNMAEAEVAKLVEDKAKCELIADVVGVISNGSDGDSADPLAETAPATT